MSSSLKKLSLLDLDILPDAIPEFVSFVFGFKSLEKLNLEAIKNWDSVFREMSGRQEECKFKNSLKQISINGCIIEDTTEGTIETYNDFLEMFPNL